MQLTFDPTGSLDGFSGGGIVGYIILVIGLWPTLSKAGIPGWGALIPLYNVYLIFKLGSVSRVWMLLLLIPVVNIFASLWVALKVSEGFGHGFALAFVGLFLFAPIGFLVLGYGSSSYRYPRFDTAGAGGESTLGENGP
jgi:Family of unknown function (DUF5684)